MTSKTQIKNAKRERRHRRIRGHVNGTASYPRLSVFRSNRHLYAQVIDDEQGKTLASSSDLELHISGNLRKKAEAIGKDIAGKAAKKNIKQVVFDRGGFIYTGRIKALAEAAREGGLEF
ncbi:MAG TPA: 50S ribosomal protein L18 [Candidatus Paceibacterota bacterium]|nr:50S ribosomal protein L18 [Candidatus Paceibacterota bacterium]